ncbi:MAG: NAD(P)-dependent glycerol-3-phosphate dehydrogenase [Solobacterium sp.]|nr:NAD(P)-dependent glycerol-3-phosphate dehydrogenase [Solobacterium sp.]
MKVLILGTGSWGTALAKVLDDNGHEAVLYGISRSQIDDINHNHRNSAFFDTPLPETLRAVDSLDDARDADIILVAVPSHACEDVLKQVMPYIEKPALFITVAKGFHPVWHKRLSVVLAETIPEGKRRGIVSLIGPSHAEEVIKGLITAINAVSEDEEAAKEVQRLFSNRYFRVYTNTDVIGSEIGVAVKNIMAIACGITAGIGQGDNARAALMTRGLAEMTRFGMALGGRKETFLGLDGVGDLIVTCTSMHSRNYTAGLQVGRERGTEKFLKENTRTVEGIMACKIVREEAQRLGVDMPITEEIYQVFFCGKDPAESIHSLMSRELKAE